MAKKQDGPVNAPSKVLTEVAALANAYLEEKAAVDEADAALKEAKKRLSTIENDLLPSAMESANLSEFTTSNGINIKVKEELNIALGDGDKAAAFAWLRKNKAGDLIKESVILEFGKGQFKESAAFKKLMKSKEILDMLGFKPDFIAKQDANSTSIKAVLRKALEDGQDVPLTTFGAHHYKKAVVKIKA